MEKSVVVILCCAFAFLGYAQDSLCVFKTSTSAFLQFKDSQKLLKKGDFLDKKNSIYIASPSNVALISSDGNTYKIKNTGKYSYNDIVKNRLVKDQKNLTSKYFKLIWEELTREKSNKTIIGGVFRGDVLMQFPKDSTKLASSKLTFSWTATEENSTYYFFLKNLQTNKILKIASNGNEIKLYKNQHIFSDGGNFQWMVSTSEFPNLKNAAFHNFSLISKKDYKSYLAEYSDLTADLKALGLTENEIENSLCKTYGLCK